MPAEVEEGWYHYYHLMRRPVLDGDVAHAFSAYRNQQTNQNHIVLKSLSAVRERQSRGDFDEDVQT
jgi:hypothetical protein